MVLKNVLKHRKLNALTPYYLHTRAASLQHHNLLERYPTLAHNIQLVLMQAYPSSSTLIPAQQRIPRRVSPSV